MQICVKMAGSRVFSSGRGNASNLSVLLQNQNVSCTSQPLDALFLSASSSPSFLGSPSSLLPFTLAPDIKVQLSIMV